MADPYADAERLMRAAQEAAEAAAAGSAARTEPGEQAPPPRGWDTPRDGAQPAPSPFPDLSGLLAMVETLKGTVPPELAKQLADALRELLIALRAILDYSIARLERPRSEPVQVEDIPIE